MLTLSLEERDRLVVLRLVGEGTLTVVEGGRRLGVGVRQMRRLKRRWAEEGDRLAQHGLRGEPSNRRLDEALRSKALAKAGEPLYRDFGPTLLSEHLERDPEIGWVNPHTLRRWLIAADHWVPTKRGGAHRRRRERRSAYGELVLMDTSIHDWLEGRSGEEIVLVAVIDDATSRLFCRFFPRDTGAANRQLLVDYIGRFGRMGAVYVDRASHFQVTSRRKQRREKELPDAQTLIQSALQALQIEMIFALSPQAKGRVERLFATLQDRLIKEMRVAGIATLAQANRFLEEQFIPFWDGRFGCEPRDPADGHRALPLGFDLQRAFAETEERVVANDFTFRHANRFYQIEAADADPAMPRTRLTIERRLDGTLRFRWRERYLLPFALLGPLPKPTPPVVEPPPPQPPRTPKPLAPDHPWRRFPVLIGKLSPHRAPRAFGASAQPASGS